MAWVQGYTCNIEKHVRAWDEAKLTTQVSTSYSSTYELFQFKWNTHLKDIL